MARACFRSLDDADVVEIQILKPNGGVRALTLLVDSGFTGRSCFVLGRDAEDLVRAEMPPANVTGALVGAQNRAWVTCRVSELGLQATLVAILADLSSLSLPAGVHGIVGLNFLRRFARWGAERTTDGWQFWLSDDKI